MPDAPDLTAVLEDVQHNLYSLSGSLEAVCQALGPSPAAFALRAVIEGGIPEVMQLIRNAGVDVDAGHLARGMSRGHEVTARLITENPAHVDYVALALAPGEADDVHSALAVTVDLLRRVVPGPGAVLTRAAIPRLQLVARRLDHERRHHGAVPNPNGPE